jgi:hypothetical protein
MQQRGSKADSWGREVAFHVTKNIYDRFAKTNMGRSMTRVTPGLLTNLVTSGSSYDQRLDQHFEVFAREGKLFQSQYAMEAGGNEVFRETREIQWIIGSGTNGFAAVTTNGAYLFQGPLSFYSKIGTWALSPGYEFGNYGFNRPILAGCVACHSGQAMPAEGRNLPSVAKTATVPDSSTSER